MVCFCVTLLLSGSVLFVYISVWSTSVEHNQYRVAGGHSNRDDVAVSGDRSSVVGCSREEEKRYAE